MNVDKTTPRVARAMIKYLDIAGYEKVVVATDPDVNLHAIIAIHSTTRGPAAGGLRMRQYASFDDALRDVLRLSNAMSFKNAAANLPLGGGKSILIGDPLTDKTDGLFQSFGRIVEQLGGDYWVAEDMGIGPDDIALIARETKYVAGLPSGPFAGGDPSPVTAEGVLKGIRTALKYKTGAGAVEGRTISIQGLGHVGLSLCQKLVAGGAKVTFSDLDREALAKAEELTGNRCLAPDAIYEAPADVFAPCAIGATVNRQTIPVLRASVVAGAANNQLGTKEDADYLHELGLLYAPDFVINAGGIINVAAEILRIREASRWVENKLDELDATLDHIFLKARDGDHSPLHVAERLAAQRLLP